jgi:hypothetical protein
VKKHYLTVLLILLTIILKAQNPPMLLSFELNRFQNELLVTWEIESGNLCTGLKVEHSSDSINFTSIYEYPGICGSSTANERYSFSHTNPIANARNYYRINLNTNGVSDILGITFIKLEESGYALFPMPIESGSKLYFSNDNNGTADFSIYNSSGALVLKTEGLKTNEISLDEINLPVGVYHFKIKVADRKIEGKFIVAKK